MELLAINFSANRSLLDSLIASPISPRNADERQVQIFVKQLLATLKFLHDRKVAHLDIRPEVILLEDDHLRLADFGQSRRLVQGGITADVTGSPEFVSPEVAAGVAKSLASDMWSVGTLTYILLAGISPFLGDSDVETVRNVILGKYSLDCAELEQISSEAKDFLSKLLVLNPSDRLNVDQALKHPWLSENELERSKLSSNCLREFKYRHKWLERRVFVQQTPSSDQLLSSMRKPEVSVVGSSSTCAQNSVRTEPYHIYDYLLIKDRKSPCDDNLAGSGEKEAIQTQTSGLRLEYPTEYADDQLFSPQLLHGEHRQIEEEIANRILSDISEEVSVAGSLTSVDDIEPTKKHIRRRKSRSKSLTPQVEGFSPDLTPIASPAGTVDSYVNSIPELFSPQEWQHPSQLDPSVHIGAPLFLESLEKQHFHLDERPSPTSPCYQSLPGTKSPVLLSPSRECYMGVVIGTKQGIQVMTEPHHEKAEELVLKRDGSEEGKLQAKESVHYDEFENFMNEIKTMKERRKREASELEKLRPKNVYGDDHKPETADFITENPIWESHYQIGPETLLLSTQGASFNARVRNYRRELWGDGSPLVTQGYLGHRNQDITVRERRRFTDLIREDENIAKSVENLNRDMKCSQRSALRRIRSDISKAAPIARRDDGNFGAIFKNRLKDVPFNENNPAVVFECTLVGNPEPTVEWFFNESEIVNDGRHQISYNNGVCRLIIKNANSGNIGEYSCVAANEYAIDKTSARLVTGYPPSPPGRPEVELSSDTEVFITWEAPERSHGLECFMYRLEVRPAGENDYFSKWRIISDKIENEAAVVRYLNPLGIYQFRTVARNEFGWGGASLTSRIIQTHPKSSAKLDITTLKQQYHVSVLSKPAGKLQRPGRGLGEIMEEEEEERSESDDLHKLHAPSVTLNKTNNPEDRFEFSQLLPRGRFCKIYRALDSRREWGAECIIKLKNLDEQESSGLSDFEALSECQQENVIRLIAAYQINNLLYLCTEQLQDDLFERFTYRDIYNEEQISHSVRQIASALHWIHFKGYVHLDVQATNVLFKSRQSWEIKLCDFGTAQRIGNELVKAKNLNLYWTPPELLRDDNKPIPTAQCDMWGLGLITFCLLSGFHPFAAADDSDSEVKSNILNQKCNPNLIHVQASEESLRFVTWALKKDPFRRMRTDEALLHRWLSNDGIMVRRRQTICYPSSRLRKTAMLAADFMKREKNM